MTLISNHALLLLAGWYVFSSMVSGMPAPTSTSGVSYTWAYRSLHLLAGNLGQIVKKQS